MQATRILAIRHGETAWNVDTRIQGQLDIGLNDTGHWQARRVAQALAEEPLDAIYSSDLQRALDTARAIADHSGGTVQPEPGLRERHFGHLQGQTWSDIAQHWPQDAQRWRGRDPDWAPQGGESLTALRERIAHTVATLAARHMGQQIVLVAHGGVMDALYRLATGQDTRTPRTWHLGNAAINRLLWTPQGLSLIGWGDVSHLEAAPQDELGH
jgi:probable phosphoglycerate mutase